MDIRPTFSVKRPCSVCERYRGAACEFCGGKGERVVECYAHELTDEEMSHFYAHGTFEQWTAIREELGLRKEDAA